MTDPTPFPANASGNTTPTPALRVPNLYAVASGKGGVGKTWFSITLCHALAMRGKRVLLFDGDLGLANIDIQLGLTPDKDLGAVIDGKATLAGAITRYTDGKFDILAGRSGSGNLAMLPTQKLSALRSDLIALAASYDHVVIDLGAGVDRATRQMAGPSAISFIVVNDEPTSLTDAYATVKVLVGQQKRQTIRMVINQTARLGDGRAITVQLQQVLDRFVPTEPGRPIKLVHMGDIPADPAVRQAIMRRQLLMQATPSCPAAMAISQLALKLEESVISRNK